MDLKNPKHVKGKCDIVDKVCRTCGVDFNTPPGLVQIRLTKPAKTE